jgi:ATP-binding protein involved in chromosome partitioning
MKKAENGIGIMDKPPEADPDELAKRALTRIRNKIMVMSGKGGVGKSSVSVNLAIALANKGHRVGLMDIDIHGPDIPRMLGLKGMLTAASEKKLAPLHYSDNLAAVSIESLMPDKDNAVIWRGPVKHGAIRQFISDVAWGDLDFLIIDAPPGTGDEPLTVAQLIEDAWAIVVTTPQEVALADVRKSIHFCRTVNMTILGLVENMSGFTCPHCGKTVELFGTGGGERTAARAGLELLGKIPFDPRVVQCGDAGVSFQQVHADSEVSQAFGEMAERLVRASGL